VLSVPNGEELSAALRGLDLFVAIDLYVSDTARHADYVLPATTFLEREDFPLPFLNLHTKPFIQMTEAVVEPRGEARQEWEIIDEISKRIGVVPSPTRAGRLLGKLGVKVGPQRLVDLLLRTGPNGDLFGVRRGGMSLGWLAKRPHGVVLADYLKAGVLPGQLRNKDGRVHLDPPQIRREVERLQGLNGDDPDFPLRLIGLRELRSHNSWMHNASLLMRGGREHAARVHPDDAAEHGIEDGAPCRISSPSGSIEITARVTDEVVRGTVAVPHGWGHRGGGWTTANDAGGANVNLLASSDPADLEPLAGMAFFNGIPIRLEAVRASKTGDEGEQAQAEPVEATPA
jgi:anaerobic selenocysteine-containing dehydrogenase